MAVALRSFTLVSALHYGDACWAELFEPDEFVVADPQVLLLRRRIVNRAFLGCHDIPLASGERKASLVTMTGVSDLNMQQQFSDALQRLGRSRADFSNLERAYHTTQDAVIRARAHFAESVYEPCVDIIGLGSMGRFEMSEESDFDSLIICNSPKRHRHRRLRAIVDEVRKLAIPGVELRAPGKTGLFGVVIGDRALYEVIGLEADTNGTHSRRTLVLEESVSLHRPDLHQDLLRKIALRYVEAIPLGSSRVPRFLVNDLARYWRQLTVDYQAKSEVGPQSTLRRLKLIGPRKFTYACSVLPLLTLELRALEKDQIVERIVEVFQLPPTLRFLKEVEYLRSVGADEALVEHGFTVMKVIDEFHGLLADANWRKVIQGARSRDEVEGLVEYERAHDLARELQKALDEFFFSPMLQPLTRKYLVF